MLNEYREDLRVECEKFGVVKKVILFDVSSLIQKNQRRLVRFLY